MTEQAENNVVSINGKDYDPAEFSNEQNYVIAQLRDLMVLEISSWQLLKHMN